MVTNLSKFVSNRHVLQLFLCLILSNFSIACTWTTTGASTVWTDPAAWTSSGSGCSGTTPSTSSVGTGDVVIVNHNMNMTATGAASTYAIKNGGQIIINIGVNFTITGNLDIQNGSMFTLSEGGNLSVSGNFTNSNNSTGVIINGAVTVGGNLTSGAGATITSTTNSGSFSVSGSVSGSGSVFGSTTACADTGNPCVTTAASPLSVELISFQAVQINERSINITWSTASELNSQYFTIHHSTDGVNWKAISTVAAAFNSTEITNYSIYDDNSSNGTNYYRLTQFDVDGQYKQYEPISVKTISLNSENEIGIYPNPGNEVLNVEIVNSKIEGAVSVEIFNAAGVLIETKGSFVQSGYNNLIIEDLNANTGIYFIQLRSENFTSERVKYIRQ